MTNLKMTSVRISDEVCNLKLRIHKTLQLTTFWKAIGAIDDPADALKTSLTSCANEDARSPFIGLFSLRTSQTFVARKYATNG